MTARVNSTEELISVIIPVYNVKPYLQMCAETVFAQTFRNLEIIFVDDGSTDGSGELCDELARKDPRVRVIHQENGGLSDARNTGIMASTGAFLFWSGRQGKRCQASAPLPSGMSSRRPPIRNAPRPARPGAVPMTAAFAPAMPSIPATACWS